MPRALILGGTGLIGRAIAARLLASGWQVDLTGRDPRNLPSDLAAAGAEFHRADRADNAALREVFAPGADLLVDCLCYTAADAASLVPLLPDAASAVMLSSRAVYVDEAGNHVNSDVRPHFAGPVKETQPTMAPGDGDFNSREGYGANKVAAERVLLDTGAPVTVLRVSKVHGVGAPRPREWVFAKRVLDKRPAVFLAHRGAGADHSSAAANIAALTEVVAANPGCRILHSADPDAPSALEISRTVARHFGHHWDEVLLDDGILGRHPWETSSPIMLDMSAALALGYRPAGDYAETVAAPLDWLAATARRDADGRAQLAAGLDEEFFSPMFDYAAEDRYLAGAS